MVASAVQPGRLRILIHPGLTSGVYATATPGQAVVELQVRKRFSLQGDHNSFNIDEDPEAELAGLLGQRKHHLGVGPWRNVQ